VYVGTIQGEGGPEGGSRYGSHGIARQEHALGKCAIVCMYACMYACVYVWVYVCVYVEHGIAQQARVSVRACVTHSLLSRSLSACECCVVV